MEAQKEEMRPSGRSAGKLIVGEVRVTHHGRRLFGARCLFVTSDGQTAMDSNWQPLVSAMTGDTA